MAMWRYEATMRIGKVEQLSIDSRSCPDECGGFLGRLAERQYKRPYTWIPIGWRCNTCGYTIIDTKVNV